MFSWRVHLVADLSLDCNFFFYIYIGSAAFETRSAGKRNLHSSGECKYCYLVTFDSHSMKHLRTTLPLCIAGHCHPACGSFSPPADGKMTE